MKLLETLSELLEAPEPAHTPLGFAPYEIPNRWPSGKGKSEYSKAMEAIDASIDQYRGRRDRPDLPDHINTAARTKLYETLAKQATRNMLPLGSTIIEPARRARFEPKKLLHLMNQNNGLRAIEIARRTRFGEFDVDQDIHIPTERSLVSDKTLDTVALDRPVAIDADFRPEAGVLNVEFTRERWKHFNKSLTTHSFFLAMIDMTDQRARELFLEPANKMLTPGQHRAAEKRIGQTVRNLVSEGYNPDNSFVYPALDTYFTTHPRRLLSIRDESARKVNPNL